MKSIIASDNGKLSRIVEKEGVGYALCQKLLRKKDIKVNGKRTSEDITVLKGDKIDLYIPTNSQKTVELNIAYEDQNILVLSKPQGVESEEFYKQVLTTYSTAIFTHRLDRNTGGLIIFALNEPSYEQLYIALKDRTIEKYYTAEVYGKMPKRQATLTAYCKKDSKQSFVSVFSEYIKGSKNMITEYKVIKEKEQSSILEVKLVTGRTHQIRAHLAHEGHFIVGDGKYGKESINKTFAKKYQQLFASKIIFHFNGGVLEYLNQKQIDLQIK